MTKKTTARLVSGIQPTGKMHLGNFLGAVTNWVNLQSQYDAYFIIVDLHALTTIHNNTSNLSEDKFNLAVDLLASGIDPQKSTLFYQSDIREHSELHLILSMLTPLSWLERVPTYKDKIKELNEKNLDTYGFLGYPVLQTADILLYQGNIVPVGKDQLPHLELAREIIRRLNFTLNTTFPEPEDKISDVQLLPGIDGRKMSKSYQNTIGFSDTEEATEKKVKQMVTDPNRIRRDDPGNPEICSVFTYHKLFTDINRVNQIDTSCRSGKIGCVDCKLECASNLNTYLRPYRQNRIEILKDPTIVHNALKQGAQNAQETANETMAQLKSKIGLTS